MQTYSKNGNNDQPGGTHFEKMSTADCSGDIIERSIISCKKLTTKQVFPCVFAEAQLRNNMMFCSRQLIIAIDTYFFCGGQLIIAL